MATGPVDHDALAALRTERDALARRCAEAEERVEQLGAELAAAQERLAAYEQAPAPLTLFEEEPPADRLTGDGSDPRILSLVLAALAVVAAMVAVLTLVNGKLVTPFGAAVVVLTVGLAWGALRTRVDPVEVSVTRGIVYVEQGGSSYRFDLRKPQTPVQMVGRPGEPGWAVRFPRRNLDPFVVDGTMVDPHDFVRQLREHRPDL